MLFFWVPYTIAEYAENGFVVTLSYPDDRILPEWAKRWRRAHANLVENIVPFAIAVLAGEILNVHTEVTYWCAVLFLAARLVHPFTQIARIFASRSLVFTVGQLASVAYLIAVATSA